MDVTLDALFVKSLSYLEELHSKLFSKRYSQDDFEQLNAFFNFNNLRENLDLVQICEKVESLSLNITESLVDEIETESSVLISQYILNTQCVYLVDKMVHLHLSGALRQALAVFHLIKGKKIEHHLMKDYPQLTSILSKEKQNNGVIDGWNFNPNFFILDVNIFNFLNVNFEIIRTTDKALCAKSLNFLADISEYRLGEGIREITTEWKETKTGMRWNGGLFENIVEGDKNKPTHGFDWIADNEVIYQYSYGVGLSGGSETIQFRMDEKGNWQKVKTLQKLIR